MKLTKIMALVIVVMMMVTVYPQSTSPVPAADSAKTTAVDSTAKPAKDANVSELIHLNPSKTMDDIKGHGNSFTLTFIGMGVVFFALAALYLTFTAASKLIRHSVATKHSKTNPEKASAVKAEEMSAEVNAAIAMALYEYFNANHDQENAILTINRVSRMYSPWSSKIYNLRHHPRNW
ncbi:MAG: hypothetical protein HBSAPP04_01500 [Ignavibacteriaceae bacterium]|nr:MAG: hypothetical protein EDM75_08610 [Chlorobiota bacterium]GJQ31311.1 MAG: hypothetical protein HBSAPP04_01500 [Ignavibacteriaceae bacterium]